MAETVDIEQRLQFRALNGTEIPVDVASIERDRSGDGAITASLFLPPETWDLVLEHGCFHLDGTTERPDLEPDQKVELWVQLRPALADVAPDELWKLDRRMAEADDPLRHTEAWYVTSIRQEVQMPEAFTETLDAAASASVGVETDWAEYLSASGPDTVLEQITSYLDGEFDYDIREANMVAVTVPVGQDDEIALYAYADENARECNVYSVHPKQIPKPARNEVTRMLASRNFELERGSFGLNPADGSVRFRLRERVDSGSVAEAITRNISMMKSVYDPIKQCVDRHSE